MAEIGADGDDILGRRRGEGWMRQSEGARPGRSTTSTKKLSCGNVHVVGYYDAEEIGCGTALVFVWPNLLDERHINEKRKIPTTSTPLL
jgi:hypothetical protein